jgi:hypothetical protein
MTTLFSLPSIFNSKIERSNPSLHWYTPLRPAKGPSKITNSSPLFILIKVFRLVRSA